MDDYIQAIGGPRIAGYVVAAYVFYLVLSSAPLWWPALRTRRARMRLPRPVLFTAVVAALSYGMFYLSTMVLMIVLDALAGLQSGHVAHPGASPWHVVSISHYVTGWLFIWMPWALLAIAVWFTRRLARRWPAYCQALDA